MSLRLASVNIERSKHLPLVTRFLEEHTPDVLCVQELMQEDVREISSAMAGAACIFEPMGLRPGETPAITMGVGIFTKLPVLVSHTGYYAGAKGELPVSTSGDSSSYNNFNRVILSVNVESGDDVYKIATTHFTWSPDGLPHDEQRRDLVSMLGVLEGLGEFLLCGDFNAPRGGEIFGELAARYKDNIPPHYTTSIDGSRHRAGQLERMVDGIFSTSAYVVSNVVLHCGVSDHMAIVAQVRRAQV